jgi:hypothetical protein
MRRAYFFYLLMAAILGGGLWVVLEFGRSLRAPDDLAGDWTVRWDQQAAVPFHRAGVMKIAQSGRFFTIRIGDGGVMSLTLDRGWVGAATGRKLWMKLQGEGAAMIVSGPIPAIEPRMLGSMRVELVNGSHKYTGLATRTGDLFERRADVGGPAGVSSAR